MKNAPWIALLWAASVGGAWWFGGAGKLEAPPLEGEAGGRGGGADGNTWHSLGASSGDGRAAPREGGSGGPTLRPAEGAVAPGRTSPRAPEGLKAPSVAVVASDLPLDLEGANTPEEVLARLYAYLAAQLAGGPKEHLALYKTIDKLTQDKENEKLKLLFDDDERSMRHIYPLMRFLMDRDAQVVDLTETVFRTAAEDPAFFEGTDKDTLEVFAEGLGPMLPGAVSDERLARLRGYVTKVLAAPEESQPKALRARRDRLGRMLATWAPNLSPADALARLKSGSVEAREAVGLLRRIEPQDRSGIDIPALLGPLLAQGDYRILDQVGSLGLDARDLARLDAKVVEAASSGKFNEWALWRWLESTKRATWEAAQGFLAEGLRHGETAADATASLLFRFKPKPPSDAVDALVRGAHLSARVWQALRSNFELR